MSPLPVSAKRLAKCAVQLSDAKLVNCALVPLFNGRGVTAKVILLSADTQEYRVFDWRPGLVYVPLLGVARVDMLWATRQRAADGGPLWYHVPRRAAKPLTSSVCVKLGHGNSAVLLPEQVASVLWRRDLSRISGVWLKTSRGVQFGRWKPGWLAPDPSEPVPDAPTKPVRGWVLDPIWMR